MSIAVRTGGDAKWKERSSMASGAYEQGVKNPRVNWEEATKNAEANYKAGITDAMAKGRFGKGVAKAGSAKWQAGALAKGAQRFSQGVQLSQDAYASGIAPYLDTIKNLTLPPKGPKGSPQNIERVKAVADALRKKKMGG
jgi:hypothetical protein